MTRLREVGDVAGESVLVDGGERVEPSDAT